MSGATVPSFGDVVPSLEGEVVAPLGSWQRRARDDFDKPPIFRLVSGNNEIMEVKTKTHTREAPRSVNEKPNRGIGARSVFAVVTGLRRN